MKQLEKRESKKKHSRRRRGAPLLTATTKARAPRRFPLPLLGPPRRIGAGRKREEKGEIAVVGERRRRPDEPTTETLPPSQAAPWQARAEHYAAAARLHASWRALCPPSEKEASFAGMNCSGEKFDDRVCFFFFRLFSRLFTKKNLTPPSSLFKSSPSACRTWPRAP